jgi:hypothetical protein
MPTAAFVVFALIASLCTVARSSAQSVHVTMPQAQPQSQDLQIGVPTANSPGPSPIDMTTSDIQKQQALAASLQRQVEIRRDTDKMLQLLTELKDSFQQAEKGVASVAAVKKAEQIEKLAHSVKSKLKLSF